MHSAASSSNPNPDREYIEYLKQQVDLCIGSDNNRALEFAEQAMILSQALNDPVASAVAFCAKATVSYATGKYPESVDAWRHALEIYSRAGMTAAAAATQTSLVDALVRLGKFDEAFKLAEEARATLITLNDEIGIARLDTNIGNLYQGLDRNVEALHHYEKALAAFDAGGDELGVAVSSFNAANVHADLQYFKTARERYQLAEDIYRRREMTLAAAQARYSIGYLYFLTGNYHQAARTLRQVETEFEMLGDIRGAALCLLDLAEIDLRLNILEEAGELARTARGRFAKLGLRYEEARAAMFEGLASCAVGRVAESEALFMLADTVFRLQGNVVFAGMIAAYRAHLELMRGSPADALKYTSEARSIFERHDLTDRACHARFIEAKALQVSGRVEEALRHCRGILETLDGLALPPLKHEVLELMGDLLFDGGSVSEANEQYRLAVGAADQRRGRTAVDTFQLPFMRNQTSVYGKFIRVCLQRMTDESERTAFSYLESSKARSLAGLSTNDLDMQQQAMSVNPAVSESWAGLREQLHWLYMRLLETENSGQSKTMAAATRLRAEIREKEQAIANFTRDLEIQDPQFRAFDGAGGYSVEELQRHLGPHDALIEYWADANEFMVFVVDYGSSRVVRLRSWAGDVTEQIMEMKFLLEKFRYGREFVDVYGDRVGQALNESLQYLYKALFAPIANAVRGKNLVIVPFGALSNVPFHALFNGTKYLIDDHQIAYAHSARLYAFSRMRQTESAYGQKRVRLSIFGALDEKTPHIGREVEIIRDCVPDAQCFVDAAATRQSLFDTASSADILHIASQASFRYDNSMFSAFKLADEWLNAYDVSLLRLNQAVVTLSGCSNGDFRVYGGDELMGLVRSFLKAGASSLIFTLWPVNHAPAALLMGNFYRRLRDGELAGAALRAATIEVKARHPNPYYWAPFIMM